MLVNLFRMASADVLPLVIGSYNCRSFNSAKCDFIAGIFAKVDILLIQEHWLAEAQLQSLSSVDRNILYNGVSGFDNSELLLGRPFGGCAILWRSTLAARISPVA